MTADDKRVKLILLAIGFTIGFAATAMAEFVQPKPLPEKPAVTSTAQEPVRMLAAQAPVRIVGPPFVLNINPREH